MCLSFKSREILVVVGLALASVSHADKDSRFKVTNLVSDIPGLAPITDPNLVNPWGIALNPGGGPFWVSNAGTGTSTLYGGDVNGSPFAKNALVVTIPGGLPTGIVFSPSNDFKVTNGVATQPARFIFASLSGNITGWNPAVAPATQARLGIGVPGALYTGLALGNDGSRNLLYAANLAAGTVDVFDAFYQPTTTLGGFHDPLLEPGLAPFNIQALNGKLYVAYTNFGLGDVEGNGAVNEFDMNGFLLRRITRNDSLVQPWGLAIAPPNFGTFSNALLVGNFGNGRIHGFDLTTGKKLGALKGKKGGPIEFERLWALQFGNGISSGNKNSLYFTAGIENEQHGLMGKLEVE